MRVLLLVIILGLLSNETIGQKRVKIFNKKRKEVEVPNYALFIQLHDMVIEYSGELEATTDALLASEKEDTQSQLNLKAFRIRAIQSLQHVMYKSDPLVAYLDGWIFSFQMMEYMNTEYMHEYLGDFHEDIKSIFIDFNLEFPVLHESYTNSNTQVMEERIRDFALQYPIEDAYLGRTSVTDATAKWAGQTNVGFKSGLASVNDVTRNLTDRLNYYTEFTPKLNAWYIEQSIQKVMEKDSIKHLINHSMKTMNEISEMLGNAEAFALDTRDTLIFTIDHQRNKILYFFSNERIALQQFIADERNMLLNQLSKERIEIQNMIISERKQSFEEMETMVLKVSNHNMDRVEQIVDKIFGKILLLSLVLAVGMIISVILYKKL